MDEPTLTLSELLNQAAAAAGLDEREEAERLFRRATERSPANTKAWLGLGAAVQDDDEKRACYEQVLAVDPSNGEARAALQLLAQRSSPEQAADIQAMLAHTATASAGIPDLNHPSGHEHEHDDDHDHMAEDTGEVLFCANHPETETTLRCNRCGKPVCYKCVELTEVGYRCKDCIREQQNVFFNAVSSDYLIVAVVSFLLAAIAAPVIGLLFRIFGLFFGLIIAFFLGPAVGGSAATIIRRSVGRRRGRYLGIVAVVAIIIGMLVGILIGLGFDVAPSLIPLAVFLFLALSTIYATLR